MKTGTITNEFKTKFDQACKLQSEGETDQALQLLYELESIGEGPKAPVIGMIGQLLYYRKNDVEKAMNYLLKSVKLSPRSEKTSLALFHALFDQNRVDEAFNEMRRFLKLSDSEEYRRLLEEINQA